MRHNLILAAAACALAAPAQAAVQSDAAVAESTLPHSSVSVLVDPKLIDGRLVVKIAAKNLTAAPAPFGPANVSIARADGAAVQLYPLHSLINDIKLAAGMEFQETAGGRPAESSYAAPQLNVREGRLDPTGYTGGARIGQEEMLRRLPRRSKKPTITEKEAEQQIAALNQAILQDTTVAPGQIVVGQVVSIPLEFAKDQERLLHVRVRIAGDEHSFTIAAPKS